METLDTSINSEYNVDTQVTGVKCLAVYNASIEFKTIVDEAYTAHEQRDDQWSLPRRAWILEFEKSPKSARDLEAFFIRHKGKKKAFNWKWDKIVNGMDTGGDDVVYKVRFDVDKLEAEVMEMGYKKFKVPIIQLMSGE
jgi:phage-related protein